MSNYSAIITLFVLKVSKLIINGQNILNLQLIVQAAHPLHLLVVIVNRN